MRWLIIPILLAAILFFGCLGPSSPPAPPYKAPVRSNSSVTLPPTPNTTVVTPPTPPTPPKNVTKPAVNNTTIIPPVNKTNATGPVVNQTIITAPALVCGGTGGSDQFECLVNVSISQKNVSICTQLTLSTDRYKCFTRWCYSGARDYKQCQSLPNTDDRLGCLNKCNPNFNT